MEFWTAEDKDVGKLLGERDIEFSYRPLDVVPFLVGETGITYEDMADAEMESEWGGKLVVLPRVSAAERLEEIIEGR